MLYILSIALHIHCKHNSRLPGVIMATKSFAILQEKLEMYNQQLAKDN